MNPNRKDITMWTQAEAIELCREIENICPAFGCHVALTGGLLYKEGPRKDCDLLFYRIRQVKEIDKNGLLNKLYRELRFRVNSGFGFVHKATYRGKPVDCLFPDEDEGVYPPTPGGFIKA